MISKRLSIPVAIGVNIARVDGMRVLLPNWSRTSVINVSTILPPPTARTLLRRRKEILIRETQILLKMLCKVCLLRAASFGLTNYDISTKPAAFGELKLLRRDHAIL